MKLIFDFDDVLFNNTKEFKEHMYACIENAGISQELTRAKYKQIRSTDSPFSLKNFLRNILTENNTNIDIDVLYENILAPSKNFLNLDLIKIAQKFGRDNCFLVTNGEEEFQKDKIAKTGVSPLFSEIHIVPQGKKEIISEIYHKYPNEKFIFIEDRIRFIDELNPTDFPNMTIIHFKEDGLAKLSLLTNAGN